MNLLGSVFLGQHKAVVVVVGKDCTPSWHLKVISPGTGFEVLSILLMVICVSDARLKRTQRAAEESLERPRVATDDDCAVEVQHARNARGEVEPTRVSETRPTCQGWQRRSGTIQPFGIQELTKGSQVLGTELLHYWILGLI